MENPDTSCPTCGTIGRSFGELTVDAHRFTSVRCPRCELEYWTPRFIDRAYYAAADHNTYDRRRRGESFLRERHQVFLRRATPGRLLDIGCGEGAFLAAARDQGYAVRGLDLDPGNIEAARGRGLEHVHCALLLGDDREVTAEVRAAGPFDWITAFEVLEHQADPLGFLRAARTQLLPRGRLCGSVPNRDRLLVTQDRRRSRGDFPPHHFLWFSSRALTEMLRAAGFQHVTVLPVPERDVGSYASFLENSLLGGLTAGPKRSLRRAVEPQGPGPIPSVGSRLIRGAKRLKNAPFVPLAMAAAWLLPGRSRAWYFEAS